MDTRTLLDWQDLDDFHQHINQILLAKLDQPFICNYNFTSQGYYFTQSIYSPTIFILSIIIYTFTLLKKATYIVSDLIWLHSSGQRSQVSATRPVRGYCPETLIFSSSSLSCRDFSNFSCSFFLMFLSLGITMAIFLCLFTTTMSGWLAMNILSLSGTWPYTGYTQPCVGAYPIFNLKLSRPYLVQMFLYTMPATWLWDVMYALPQIAYLPLGKLFQPLFFKFWSNYSFKWFLCLFSLSVYSANIAQL